MPRFIGAETYEAGLVGLPAHRIALTITTAMPCIYCISRDYTTYKYNQFYSTNLVNPTIRRFSIETVMAAGTRYQSPLVLCLFVQLLQSTSTQSQGTAVGNS